MLHEACAAPTRLKQAAARRQTRLCCLLSHERCRASCRCCHWSIAKPHHPLSVTGMEGARAWPRHGKMTQVTRGQWHELLINCHAKDAHMLSARRQLGTRTSVLQRRQRCLPAQFKTISVQTIMCSICPTLLPCMAGLILQSYEGINKPCLQACSAVCIYCEASTRRDRPAG